MNLPDFLTSRCKDPVRPAKWGKVWLVHHPEQICQVLRRPLSFGKGGELWDAVRRLLGKSSLIAMENRAPEDFSRWSEAREKAQKLLSGVPEDIVHRYAESLVQRLSRKLGTGDVVDLRAEALRYTGEVILEAAAPQAKILTPDLLRLADEAMGLLTPVMIGPLLPWPLLYLTERKRFDRVCEDLTELLQQVGVVDEARDELITLLVAGRDATAAALTWMLLRNGELNYSETLRSYPPIWFLPRICTSSYQITDSAEDTAQPGDVLLLLLYSAEQLHPSQRILSFGEGERRCVGADLACRELLAVEELVRDRGLRFAPLAKKLEPSGDITLWPKDARVRVGGDVLDGA